MLKLDYTLIIQIINFLFLLFALNLVLYRPVRRILSQRREQMDGIQNQIGTLQSKSEQVAKEIEENVVGATKEGLREKETLKSSGYEYERGMLAEASSQAAQKIDQARKEIMESVLNARHSLERELADFSKELAEKILGRSI
ncbi:MAG: hypothetical protein JRI79_02245 [Deltaproteobacteria bacterium]|nr:hypothetical protein [Deltaproteobacteria bacterium]MBW1976780.1 hypothetical protein [Deltaproteobacteria bacterium]MBW2043643.1 hypothetical protein [Deltaproteobacteria bacterium]MBW2300461.1 hypothetical protein [Deltaproteobacteria bacterium]RLB34837.1 MAG: hypothetical protein DRH11_04730 [Deltaproteobacteria bacterium]